MRVTFVAVFVFAAVLFVGAIARPGGTKEHKKRLRRSLPEWDASRGRWISNTLIDIDHANTYRDSRYPSVQRPVNDLAINEGAYGDDDFVQNVGPRDFSGRQISGDAYDYLPQDTKFGGSNEENNQQERTYQGDYAEDVDDEEDDYEYDSEDEEDEERPAQDGWYPEENSKFDNRNPVQRDGSRVFLPRKSVDDRGRYYQGYNMMRKRRSTY